MNKQDIITNNILIAEFLRLDKKGDNYIFAFGASIKTPSDLDYHKSWDSLFYVIREITDRLKHFDQKFRDDWYEVFEINLLVTSKKTVYDFCIDFIKWYNKNKK